MAETSLDTPALVVTPEEYAEAFVTGEEIAVAGLYGRILQGEQADDFEALSNNSEIVLLMGDERLARLPGLSGHAIFEAAGQVEQKNAGGRSKLVVFSEDNVALPATWANTLSLVGGVYPEATYGLLANRMTLQRTPFEKIEGAAGYRFSEVDANGTEDDRFMTYERYVVSGMGLIATRAFLYHTVRLGDTYVGDGQQEYVTYNSSLSDLGEYVLLDLPND